MNNEETIRQFLAALLMRDLTLAEGTQLVADGKWRRCRANNKGSNNTSGSYLLHADGVVPWGLYQNWTDGKGVDHWCGSPTRQLAEAEQQELVRRVEEARIKHEEEARARAEAARRKAGQIWEQGSPASADHPYLARKGAKPRGLRVSNYGRLLVPMYDADGRLVNLQFIDDSGAKWFLVGGRVKGCFLRIKGSFDMLVIAEGFATGASIYEAIGCCVAVAFNAGNLLEVAMAARRSINGLDASIWSAHKDTLAGVGLVHAERPKFINTKLVVAADDDWKTPDNPGVMKGLAAARSAKALIAIPLFGDDRTDKQTDFNDLAAAKGLESVRVQINAAMDPTALLERLLLADPHASHSEAMIKQLADLNQRDPVAYEKLLAQLKKAKVRIRPLEKEIKKEVAAEEAEEAKPATEDLHEHWSVEPWDQPIDTAELLDEINAQISKYVATLGERVIAVTLWVMFSWVHDTATHSPILLATSAEPDCGKTTLLGVIGFLARRALLSVNISGAALFRSLAKWQPTLIVDEADTALVDKQDLKEVVNSGWTRNQGVVRCDPETNEPHLYSTFAPKVVGMKGRKLPDTTLSRSLVIELHRKSAAEDVQDFLHLDDPAFVLLRRKLLRWANDNAGALRAATPQMPTEFRNRMRMNWWSLFAIADLAGKGEAVRKAAAAIENNPSLNKSTLGQRLLSDIRDIFAGEGVDEMLSRDLVTALVADVEGPWAEYRRGKPLSQKQLANLLAPFGICSEEIHPDAGSHGKGYKLVRFKEAFERYLINSGAKPASEPRYRANAHSFKTSSTFRSARDEDSARIENDGLFSNNGTSRGSADRTGDKGAKLKKSRPPFRYAPEGGPGARAAGQELTSDEGEENDS